MRGVVVGFKRTVCRAWVRVRELSEVRKEEVAMLARITMLASHSCCCEEVEGR